jgi:hypothetical protein
MKFSDLYRDAERNKVDVSGDEGGGKPPFPTGEQEGVGLEPLNAPKLTGREGRLAPAPS